MSFVLPPSGARHVRIDVDAGSLAAWHRPGSGQPIVMLHGNTSSKEAFRRLFACEQLDDCALVALDLPGAGESENSAAPERDYTIPGLASTVIDVLARLEIDHPILLGWSLGGHIAIEAVAQGLGAKAMVLTGTPPCGPGGADIAESFRASEIFAVGTSLAPDGSLLDKYIASVFGCPVEELSGSTLAQARRFDGKLRATFSEHWLSGTSGHNQRALIASWTGPTAVITGENEPFFDPGIIDRLEWANLWRSSGLLVKGAGHAPFFDHARVYAQLLQEFIADIR